MRPPNTGKSNELYNVLIGMALGALILAVAAVGVVRLLENLGPRIGDFISFDRSRRISTGVHAQITVTAANSLSTAPCILDVHVMGAAGGSLMIAAVHPKPNPSFRVHWAGGRTSDGVTDCGTTADFLLSRTDLATLTFAAGGKNMTDGMIVTP